MANKVTMSICGQEYTLVADESAEYMKKVGALVDQRMDRIQETLHVSQADAAVLAAAFAAPVAGGRAAEKPGSGRESAPASEKLSG